MNKIEQFFEELDQEGNPKWQRIFFLERANGSFIVNSWGYISYGKGHQRGLEQEDALELMQASAFISGMEKALEFDRGTMTDLLNKYREKYDTWYDEKNKPTTESRLTEIKE